MRFIHIGDLHLGKIFNDVNLLEDQIDILNQIREENDVSFYLEIVPYLYPDNDTPCLAPSLEIMDFCTKRTTIFLIIFTRVGAKVIDILRLNLPPEWPQGGQYIPDPTNRWGE